MSDRLVVLVLAEGTALLIALVMPVTPSKTGSDWSLAEVFVDEPSYLFEVLVYFLFTNLLLVVLAIAFVAYVRLSPKDDEG